MNNIPKLGHKLFSPDGNIGEMANFAWGDTEIQFYGYITGYKEAADAVIQHAIEKGLGPTLDKCVFPACFLYRQYIELTLKDIYLSNSNDNKDEKMRTIKDCRHDLKKIWAKTKELILHDFPDEDIGILNAVEDYISQFVAEDVSSLVFRYPIKTDLDPVHSKGKSFNLLNLAVRMGELENYLSSISFGMSANRDTESEILWYSYYNDMDCLD